MKNLRNYVNSFNRVHEEYPSLDGELIAHLKKVISYCERHACNSYYDIFGPVAKKLKWILSLPYGSDLSRFSPLLEKKFGLHAVCYFNLASLGDAVADAIECAKDDVLGTESDPEIQEFVLSQEREITNIITKKDFFRKDQIHRIFF